ncbi:MAG: AGE family epimerase/isomerase [Longimicrobiales bacterium]|nr:AGE family epimerase/isomerase [Longimicrobiales bacterium]
MSPDAAIEALEREAREELVHGILPFWSGPAVDAETGGFVGWVGPDGRPDPEAPRGGVLNARILWAFSAAHRGGSTTAAMAARAADVFTGRFLDPEHGGVYWTVDRAGRPVDDRKHVYAQAFGVYALAEHHRATGAASSLQAALALFEQVERRARDPEHGGYREAFARDWTPLDDARLGEGDLDVAKSENTHLHVLEAYTTLLRAAPGPEVEAALRSLVELFLDRIIDPAGHVLPFFDRDWTVRSRAVSFGHDIETAWLLADATDALGDAALGTRSRDAALLLTDTVLREGLDREHGGVFYEVRDGMVDREKEWWTQAEAVVGFLHAYQDTARPELLAAALDTWAFLRTHLVDREAGEWRRRVDRDGTPQPGHETVGPWKGPYHNTRACLEIMARARTLTTADRP